jgi:hypothetical protein
VTLMRRLLLARHVLGAVTDSTILAKLASLCAVIVIVAGLVAAVLYSRTALFALMLSLAVCAFLLWTIAPAIRDLDEKIVQLVRLEIGGHGLIIDFEKPDGRAFLSGDVKLENATGCDIRLKSYVFEQVGIDSPGAAPLTLQAPESTCDDVVPRDASRFIKLERHEFFGGRESLGEAACVPMKLTVSVRFEVEGEHITGPASRTLQCYAFVRSAPREKMLLQL